jgi:hypothetical protein
LGLVKLMDCVESRAKLKIVSRVDGSTDESLCPANSRAFPFVKPPRLYCAEVVRR